MSPIGLQLDCDTMRPVVIPDPLTVATSWHPPRGVLELAELVITGVLPGLPSGLRVPADTVLEGTVLEDAEGTPVATLGVERVLHPARPFTQGPLRARRSTPAELAAAIAGSPDPRLPTLVLPLDRPLTVAQVTAIADSSLVVGRRLLWLVLIGEGRPGPMEGALTPEGLWRAISRLAAARGDVVVPVALPAGYDELLPHLADAYAGSGSGEVGSPSMLLAPPAPTVGEQLHPAFARELARERTPALAPGAVVLFTGLSGSGKSTLAKALAERVLEDGDRRLTMLDGDEVRRLLSHGLGFTRADRDLNVRRIGYVAAEVARHRGLAICAPIAPFAAVRAEVRALVEQAGGDFVLIHVATSLAECERRDRKGLYAKARRGEIAEVTGISSPYEAPTDADLVIDTTGRSIAECLESVLALLQKRGLLVDGDNG